MIENTLWVEKFRPARIEDYIGNTHLVDKFKMYIEKNDIPTLLLYGKPGTGKTTAAKILAKAIDADIMMINASDENSVETIREKIKGFVSSIGFSRWKVVILDESDYLSANSQAILRNLIETFSATSRFILTCNYVDRIIPALISRCQQFEIHPPDKKQVALRLKDIIDQENIKYRLEDIVHIINSSYPDIRKAINIAQNSVLNGELIIKNDEKVRYSYMDDILNELKSSSDNKTKFKNIRQIIADSKVSEFTSLYRFLYDHIEEFAKGKIANAILIIADAQYKDAMVIDKEITVCAMFVNLLNEI